MTLLDACFFSFITCVVKKHQRLSGERLAVTTCKWLLFAAWHQVYRQEQVICLRLTALTSHIRTRIKYECMWDWRTATQESVLDKIAAISRQLSLEESDQDHVHKVVRSTRGHVREAVQILERAQEEALLHAMEGSLSTDEAKVLLSASGRSLKSALESAQARVLESAADEHRDFVLRRGALYGIWRMSDLRKRHDKVMYTIRLRFWTVQIRLMLTAAFERWNAIYTLGKKVRSVHPKYAKAKAVRMWHTALKDITSLFHAGAAILRARRDYSRRYAWDEWRHAVKRTLYIRRVRTLAETLGLKLRVRMMQACLDGMCDCVCVYLCVIECETFLLKIGNWDAASLSGWYV
jgi:hypothetical protein